MAVVRSIVGVDTETQQTYYKPNQAILHYASWLFYIVCLIDDAVLSPTVCSAIINFIVRDKNTGKLLIPLKSHVCLQYQPRSLSAFHNSLES